MPSIQVPKEFFKKERQQIYTNWPVAFWRELVQNASDAGAHSITITLEQQDGFITVSFQDNGPGMSRDVMENVYFRLGETTKGGPSDSMKLGGFGRARILTCFSMRSYTIRTQNILVTGDGADYTIEDAEPVEGCLLKIDVEDVSLEDMHTALRVFLRQSQLGCRVRVNGEEWTQWALRGALVTKLVHDGSEFASVYVQPTGLLHHVIIRSKGVQSYFQISRVPKQVTIEIDPQLLRTVMTGNRDGLVLSYAKVVDEFLEEMALNSSILRPPQQEVTLHDAKITFTSRRNELLDRKWRELPDFFIFNDSRDEEIYNQAKTYLPDRWGRRKQQLMLIWRIACDMAIDALIQETQISELKWAVGWYFGDAENHAVTRRKGGIHVFCLNPMVISGNIRSIPVQRRILAIAEHEVTHARFFSHDEDFASLFTEIVASVDAHAFHEAANSVSKPETLEDEAERKRLLKKKRLSPTNARILIAFRDCGAMTREELMMVLGENHFKSSNHARLSDLSNEDIFGEKLVDKFGDLKWHITAAGRRRLQGYERDELRYQKFVEAALEMYPAGAKTEKLAGWIGVMQKIRDFDRTKPGTNDIGGWFAARFNKEHFLLFKVQARTEEKYADVLTEEEGE